MEITLQHAADILDSLRNARPTCSGCQHVRVADTDPRQVFVSPASEYDALAQVVIHRCAACLKPLHPWAHRLSVERLHEWLKANPLDVGGLVDVTRIRDDLTVDRGGFRFLWRSPPAPSAATRSR